MTRTGLANMERKSKEEIAASDRKSREDIASANRKSNEQIAEKTSRRNLIGNIVGGAIKGPLGFVTKHFLNNPEFYKRYIKDLGNFTRVPTYYRIGTSTFEGSILALDGKKFAQPGIIKLSYVLGSGGFGPIGALSSAQIPINVGLARLKEKVLALNSRSNVNWEPGDLAYNLICSGSIILVLTKLRRLIAVASTYKAENHYWAKAMLQALGVSQADLFIANLPGWRQVYSTLVRHFNSAIVAPSGLAYYARILAIESNIFADSEHDSAGLYVYDCDYLYMLKDDATECEAISCARWFDGQPELAQANIEQMIVRISENPDYIEMYQDLRHAFSGKLIQLDETISDAPIIVNHDEYMRSQIHNVQPVPWLSVSSTFVGPQFQVLNITQDNNGYVLWPTRFKFDGVVAELSKFRNLVDKFNASIALVFNTYGRKAEGDDVLEVTRNRQLYAAVPGGEGDYTPEIVVASSGVDVVYDVHIYTYYLDTDGTSKLEDKGLSLIEMHLDSASEVDALTPFNAQCSTKTLLGYFDWAPMVRLICVNDQNEVYASGVHGDLDHPFMVSGVNLVHIDEACNLSLFYVPDEEFVR